ncbi:hypothetical protein AB0E01_23855 [Nocardia vinacea]|uniref:hypothetical protein n=1 Tax=Nocardia vinacea TaxID=96468 RepID=UPI00340AED3D
MTPSSAPRATFAHSACHARPACAMTLGALVAAVARKAFLGNQVGFIGDLAGLSATSPDCPRSR